MLDLTHADPPRKPWKWILADSAVIAGIAFVSTLPTSHLPNLMDLYVAVKAFAYSLLIQIAVERGIKPRLNNRGTG